MGDFDLGVSLIVLFGIILVAICIIVTMKHNAQANEKYGDLQRRKLIAHYAADYGETGASANKLPSSQEGYQANRGSLIVPNSFNWLMNNNGTQSEQSGELITAPKIDVSNPNTTVAEDIGNAALSQIQSINDGSQTTNISSGLTQTSYNTDATAGEITPGDTLEVVSNSGKSLGSETSEPFGLSRIYNDFSTITSGSTESSTIAQSENQVQTSVDMKQFEKENFRRRYN